MKNPINKWLHISDMGGDPWILPIWSAINDAVSSGKTEKLPQSTIELGMHISTRLNMLWIVKNRINLDCVELYETVKNADPKYEYTPTKRGYAFDIKDDLKLNILIDIDAFLFELNSCCELIGNLLKALYEHVGKPITKAPGLVLKDILKNAGIDTGWFIDLDYHRNFFMHSGAPYIIVNITNAPRCDLIITKENIKTFDNQEKFLQLSDIDNIFQGFLQSKPIIQESLIKLFNKL
ncbi:MAG: hypothetical protein IH950_14640 [Bacteroidetes bacterium]|nr:hypothetical protein [Bacteroidota bacterium]